MPCKTAMPDIGSLTESVPAASGITNKPLALKKWLRLERTGGLRAANA